MPTSTRLAVHAACCVAVAATWFVWNRTAALPEVSGRGFPEAASVEQGVPAPALPQVDAVRSLVASAEAEADGTEWRMEGTVRGAIDLPGRFTLKPHAGEASKSDGDLTVLVDEAGRFQLRAPLPSWRPFRSYAFVVTDRSGNVRLDGWCVLERALALTIPDGVELAGTILEPGGELGSFEYAIRTASPVGAGVFLARGATDAAGAFRQRVGNRSHLRAICLSARSKRTGRLYLFEPAAEELLSGQARFECRDVVTQVSIVDQAGRRPADLVVRAAFLDALENHLELAVTFDAATNTDQIVCSTNGRLEVSAMAPGCRPVIAHHRVVADGPPFQQLGQLVLEPETTLADLAGRVVDATGQPVVGANVIVIPFGWSLEPAAELAKTTLVDEEGRFAIPVDRSGRYTVLVQHPKFPSFSPSQGPVTVDSHLVFTMPAIGAVRIEPTASSTLGAAHWSGPLSYVTTSRASDGGMVVDGQGDLWNLSQALPLPTGRNAIHVSPIGLGHYGYAEFDVVEGETARLQVPLTPTRRVHGVVRDQQGRAVFGAKVELVEPGIPEPCRREWFGATTDRTGAFELVVPDLARTIVAVLTAQGTTQHKVAAPDVAVEIRIP